MPQQPVRLQLSRRKGFDLQEVSLALNGLPAIVVARPTKWGNPFRLDGSWQEAFRAFAMGFEGTKAGRTAAAVELYRMWLAADWRKSVKVGSKRDRRNAWQREVMTVHGGQSPPTREQIRRELGGRNLACWCKIGGACHADILLSISNGGDL